MADIVKKGGHAQKALDIGRRRYGVIGTGLAQRLVQMSGGTAGQVTPATHEIVSPRDPASGLPTGKRMHKPFTFT